MRTLFPLVALLLVACQEPSEPQQAEAPAPEPTQTSEAPADPLSRRLERIADVAIGASPDAVRRGLTAQGAEPSADAPEAGDDLYLSGGTYAGLPVERWLLSFQEGGLHAGQIRMIPSPPTDSAFARVAAHLQDVYGDGEDTPPLPAMTEAIGDRTPAERGRLWSFANGLVRLRTTADTLTVHFSAEDDR